jgi:hypothetical protein
MNWKQFEKHYECVECMTLQCYHHDWSGGLKCGHIGILETSVYEANLAPYYIIHSNNDIKQIEWVYFILEFRITNQ